MIQPDAVLVADRPAMFHDDAAGRAFQNLPAAQRFIRAVSAAVEIGYVDAGPIFVHVREVGKDKDMLADFCQSLADDLLGFFRRWQDRRPRDGSLQRIQGVTALPERVAQIGRQEARFFPHFADGRARPQPSVGADDIPGRGELLPGSLILLFGGEPRDQQAAPFVISQEG